MVQRSVKMTISQMSGSTEGCMEEADELESESFYTFSSLHVSVLTAQGCPLTNFNSETVNGKSWFTHSKVNTPL